MSPNPVTMPRALLAAALTVVFGVGILVGGIVGSARRDPAPERTPPLVLEWQDDLRTTEALLAQPDLSAVERVRALRDVGRLERLLRAYSSQP